MTDLNFNDMSDPEKLRSELRKQFKGLDDESLDALATDDETRHLMELSEYFGKWAVKHTEVLKLQGKKNDTPEVIGAMMRGLAATLIAQLKKEPLALVMGGKAFADMFQRIMLTSTLHAVHLRTTDPRFMKDR